MKRRRFLQWAAGALLVGFVELPRPHEEPDQPFPERLPDVDAWVDLNQRLFDQMWEDFKRMEELHVLGR